MRRRPRALDSLRDDIRDHLDRETQDNLARGLSPEEARRQALLTFGNVALVEEEPVRSGCAAGSSRRCRISGTASEPSAGIRVSRRRSS